MIHNCLTDIGRSFSGGHPGLTIDLYLDFQQKIRRERETNKRLK